VQTRRSNHAVPRAAREQVGGIQVVRVRVRLQAIANPGQGTTMHVGSGHDVGAEVDQEVIVDQRGGSLPQTWAAERSCPLAVVAPAKGLRISIRGGGSQERDDHLSRCVFRELNSRISPGIQVRPG
jgi:hypothetical protein